MSDSRLPNTVPALRVDFVKSGNQLHRAHELEVVVVGVGEGRDPVGRLLSDVVWLANDFGACSPELLKVPLYVLALDVEDEPARRRVLALYLVVGADRYPSAADLPAVIAPLRHGGVAEDLRVVIDEPLGILRSDHDAVEVHRYLRWSLLRPSRAINLASVVPHCSKVF